MADHLTEDGLQIFLVSPLDLHFSQLRVRAEFQDGHTVEESTDEITSVCRPPVSADSREEGVDRALPVAVGSCEEIVSQVKPDSENGEGYMLLQPTFPRIEVTKWRCKLREPDGSPKLDPVTGLELYSHDECWFTFDNRRLYCLQKAAVAQWPKIARVEVVEIPPHLARTRELRKFDTRTFGCSVLIGRRGDPDPVNWSWRAEVGLPEELQPEDGIAKQKSLRRRGNSWRGGNGPGSGKGRQRRDDYPPVSQTCADLVRSAFLFFLVYLTLRIVVSTFRRYFSVGASPEVFAPAVPLAVTTPPL